MKALDNKVGNDLVQEMSGGERKRTSSAASSISYPRVENTDWLKEEVLDSDTWIQCWDNSTRGLVSATAFNFVSLITNMARRRKTGAVISLYQASQDMYNVSLATLDHTVIS